MSKAILVIDMPESCKNCMCYVLGAKANFCERTRFAIFDNTTKPSWCPLKPAPELQDVWFEDSGSDWERGYNNCVREIMGKDLED
jgi:hypothetical protein